MFGIFLGLGLLMFLAYKGMSIIWVAPICAMIVALTGGLELLPAYTETYMTGFVGFTRSWFPVFMLGALFGKVMDDSGAARSVAYYVTKMVGTRFAMAAVVLACAILTYGGISLFVVVFAIYPLAVALFREANISRRLIPGSITAGAFTFTMTALPGSPQIQNLIPMEYFGTTPSAAPVMGIIAGIVMAAGGLAWLTYREKKFKAAGIVFTEPETKLEEFDVSTLPNPILSALPLVSVIVLLNLLNLDIVVSLLAGIILAMVLNFNRLPQLVNTLNSGASGSVVAIINTSAAVGFGTVVQQAPGFDQLTDMMMGIGGNPLVANAVSVNVLAGATGSASGGMGIALAALSDRFIEMSAASGIPIEAFHRIASLASGGLDTLPHNGAVLTLLAVCGLTHKDSYTDIFVTACAIPIVSVVVALILATMGVM